MPRSMRMLRSAKNISHGFTQIHTDSRIVRICVIRVYLWLIFLATNQKARP
jgi:hypothetical protein